MNNELTKERLKQIREYAIINNIPILRPQTADLLFENVKSKKPSRILEIGTAVGYSGMIMMSAFDGSELVTIEKDTVSAEIAKENFEYTDCINRANIICGDAIDILPCLEGKFDFIFLDGPKGQYIKYLPYLIDLLNDGGILFSDNVLYRGMVNGKTPVAKKKKTLVKNLRLFLDALDNDDRFVSQTLEIEDGVSISKKIK